MSIQEIDRSKCKMCGRCALVCPLDVFRKMGKFVYIVYPEDCMTCFLCEIECPAAAIYVNPERGMNKIMPY
jgi:NAD-dependent dihydropyrimidine dehydrogenase PreA subunit